jgi:hypothetical protein
VILAEVSVSREQIAQAVVLTSQLVEGRNIGDATELFFAEDRDSRALLRVQLLGPFQFDRLLAICAGTETFSAYDQHGRPRVHIVCRLTAKSSDESARIPAPERTQLAGEDNDVSGERRGPVQVGWKRRHRPLRHPNPKPMDLVIG